MSSKKQRTLSKEIHSLILSETLKKRGVSAKTILKDASSFKQAIEEYFEEFKLKGSTESFYKSIIKNVQKS